MASKNFMYAVYEAVQHEMRQRKDMTWLFELTPAVASSPGLPVINLEKEFGRTRVNNTGIDEMWMAGATLGAGLVGTTADNLHPLSGKSGLLRDDSEPRRQIASHERWRLDDAGGVHHRIVGPEPRVCRTAFRL